MVEIAICISSYNSSRFLNKCLSSLLNQSYSDFKIIFIDDCSIDDTKQIVGGFNDKRICYFRNEKNFGIAKSRNECLKHLKSERYVFFIDADCYAERDWLKKGIEVFKNRDDIVCVNGKTIYVSENYNPGLSEKSHIQTDNWKSAYQTCNIAYRREVFDYLKFDEDSFNMMMEDTDFALQVMDKFPSGKFYSESKMRVVHQKIYWSIQTFFRETEKVKYIVNLLKKYKVGNKNLPKEYQAKLLNKNYLFLALFPPGIIYYIIKTKKRIRGLSDFLFMFLFIAKAYYYRYLVWKYALEAKVFIL